MTTSRLTARLITLSNKVPAPLRAAIAQGKKILVLINPPYAESTNRGNTEVKLGTENKTGVATTRVGESMADYGYASRELFAQFLARIGIEMPTATVAMFSTMKYINAPNFEKFRQEWNAQYQGGFVDTRLELGGTVLELKYRKGGHTPGDMVVWLPQKSVLFAGDVVYVDRVLGLHPVSNTRNWLESLAVIDALKPQTIVPGHGNVTNLPTAQAHTRDLLLA
jgi:hypothetical protein